MDYAILTTSNSRKAGGLYGAISGLTKAIQSITDSICLISSNDEYTSEDYYAYGSLKNFPYTKSRIPLLSSFGYSHDLSKILTDIHPLVIDVQGIWMYHSMAAYKYKKANSEVRLIITPHGMLDSWAVNNSHWKKRLVGYLYEYNNLKSADCLRALCKSEYNSIREFGLKNPVAIIPNGFNLPNNPIYNREHKKRVLLFIGRIHPKKGIKELILALSLVRKSHPELIENWNVRIAGWDQNGHTQELIKLSEELGLDDCVTFVGPVFGNIKENELCTANAFVLTSFSEGLPMSVLEAWAYKLPVLMTDQCNLPEGFDENAAIRVTTSPESIAEGLTTLFLMDNSKLNQIGENGFALVSKKFSWSHIADQTIELYKWLLGEGKKPDFVYD